MANVNTILNQRIKKTENTSKMAAMAKQSATGNLTSFAGVFSVSELSEMEKNSIETILREYAQEEVDISKDLTTLISITSEVKAINNQAAILHGERIKKVHHLLTPYRDGAFTAWLIAAYGNRQTPYNLMQYYEFYESMPKNLRPQIEIMPRQAVYVLATRSGSLEKKQKIVENYQGQTKGEMLTLIRETFPLDGDDKRRQKTGEMLIQLLQRIYKQLKEDPSKLNQGQKKEIQNLLQQMQQIIG
jgi:hypothetical protein